MSGSAVAAVRYPLAIGDCLRALLGREAPASGLFVASGQEAIQLALRGVQKLQAGDRQEVVVPDFICPSVPAAVRDAGLIPRRCELDSRNWFYRPEALGEAIGSATCAVIVVSYFGFAPILPPEIGPMLKGVAVVEDLAQSYGIDGLEAPWDPPAFRTYSFARGKSLPLGWGGLLTASGDAEQHWLENLSRQRPPGRVFESLFNLALSQVQSVILHPAVWRRLPVPEQFPPEQFSLAEVAKARHGDLRWPVTHYVSSTRSLAPNLAIRRQNARGLAQRLAGCPGLHVPATDETALTRAAALRFPVLFEEPSVAEEVRRRLQKERIIKGPNDFDDYGDASANASEIARCLVTLPTYRGSEPAQRAAVEVIRQVTRVDSIKRTQ